MQPPARPWGHLAAKELPCQEARRGKYDETQERSERLDVSRCAMTTIDDNQQQALVGPALGEEGWAGWRGLVMGVLASTVDWICRDCLASTSQSHWRAS
jgi:hypothetical protein